VHACGYSVPNKCSSMHFTHFPMWRALSGTTFVALSTYWSSRTDRSRWLVEPRRVKGQAQALGDWPVLSPIRRNSALCVKVLHRQSLPNSAGACHPPHPRRPVPASQRRGAGLWRAPHPGPATPGSGSAARRRRPASHHRARRGRAWDFEVWTQRQLVPRTCASALRPQRPRTPVSSLEARG
jgi:hypothetical protein